MPDATGLELLARELRESEGERAILETLRRGPRPVGELAPRRNFEHLRGPDQIPAFESEIPFLDLG